MQEVYIETGPALEGSAIFRTNLRQFRQGSRAAMSSQQKKGRSSAPEDGPYNGEAALHRYSERVVRLVVVCQSASAADDVPFPHRQFDEIAAGDRKHVRCVVDV